MAEKDRLCFKGISAAVGAVRDVLRSMDTVRGNDKPHGISLQAPYNAEIPLDINALISDGVEIINPFPAAAKPLYRFNVNFNGTGETTTCRVSLSVTANYDGVYEERRISKSGVRITATHHLVVLDLEKQHATVQDENGDIYSYIDMDLPDPIGEGRATIKIIYQSKTVGLSIIPRWRGL